VNNRIIVGSIVCVFLVIGIGGYFILESEKEKNLDVLPTVPTERNIESINEDDSETNNGEMEVVPSDPAEKKIR
jgi:hypothetical protein